MLSVLTRSLQNPRDYLGILQTHTLTFLEKRHEGGDYYSFIYKPTTPLQWRAGQHGILHLPTSTHDKGWRPFSVASSDHEDVVRIGTRIPEPHSEFKTVLQALEPGTDVQFRGPYGEFHANRKSIIIGVAGGIGITPFRALAYEIAHGHNPDTQLYLTYASEDEYPYRAELDEWQSWTGNLEITYVSEPAEVETALQNHWNTVGNAADYFLSGSPGMINGVSNSCRKLGARRIVYDPFTGY